MKIKQFYLNNYPTDELGVELNENANFTGLLNELFTGNDIYGYIGHYLNTGYSIYIYIYIYICV